MRKILGLIVLSIAVFAVFNSCKKDYANEHYTPITDTSKPDLSTKITASVSGFITDENNNAITGAQVTAGTQTVSTDQYGYFKISSVSLSKTAAFIKVTSSGYFNGYSTFIAKEGKETFTRLKLIPKTNVGTINATTGGTVNGTDGSSVTLPANAVVTASSGNAYTGTIQVAAHWLNPTADDLNLNMPGNLLGIDTAGYLKVLETYGMLAVELTDATGNILQIASGKQATLSFPVPTSLSASAPTTIPLWSFNETNGLWKQESEAKKTGSNYVGNVSHFSYWNCDIGYSPVAFTAQIVDSSLHPLANTEISITGNQFNSYNHGYTDTSGFIYGMVPANSNLNLNITTQCAQVAYIKKFATQYSNVDFGTISTNINQYALTVTGSVLNCNNNPVSDGIVIITGTNGYYGTVITNGSFSFNTAGCINVVTSSIVAIDLETQLSSGTKTILLNHGINNIATLTTSCNNSVDTLQYLVFTLDSISGSIPIPPNYVSSSGYLTSSGPHTYFSIFNAVSGLNSLLSFGGDSSIGSNHPLQAISLSTPRYISYNPSPNQFVNVTQYDSVGGYISGNFDNATIINSIDSSSHKLSLSFKFLRKQ